LRDFLLLPIEAIAAGRNFTLTWKAGGPWKE
jgi:hypothetical protein